ncbi:MAG: MBL fold metallo-hydrolase [Planctomycetes bacterium]|nr:MBL fold metallo-hydrolase [Planctomycetota bacterium]
MAPPKDTARLTVLVDNTVHHETLLAEHGLSFWIEKGNKQILFDTGQSNIIQTNAQILGIDFAQADAIVISHGHYDHTGGLLGVLDKAKQAKLFLHPDALRSRFACDKQKPGRNIGMPAVTAQYLAQHDFSQSVVWTTQPTEIGSGITVTGPIRRFTDFEDVGGAFFLDSFGDKPDLLPDDQALFFETSRGLVVVLGCAHSGVVNTLHYIADYSGEKEFYAVLGGMHLSSASPERIERTIEIFRVHNVQRIGPAHCTGIKAVAKLWEAFPDRCFSCWVGAKIEFEK